MLTVRKIEILDSIFLNREHPAYLGGISELFLIGKRIDKTLTKKEVVEYLSYQPAHQFHARVVHKFPREKIVSHGFNDMLQIDLADMKKLADYQGKRITFLLVCVDALSKMWYVRPLKNKTGIAVTEAMRDIIETELPYPPVRIVSDFGKEFIAGSFQDLCKTHDILWYGSVSPFKAAIAEAAIKELKNKLYRYMTQFKTRRYLNILPHIVNGHNRKFNRRLGFSPASINAVNAHRVFKRLFPRIAKGSVSPEIEKKLSKFKVGETVRLSRLADKLRHGFYERWSQQIYEIVEVVRRPLTPIRYKLRVKGSDATIPGVFSNYEMVRVLP